MPALRPTPATRAPFDVDSTTADPVRSDTVGVNMGVAHMAKRTGSMQEAAAVTLDGSVERITFYNPENGFTVLRLRVRGHRDPVAVVGTLPAVQPGELLALSGHWRTDPRHGAQFEPRTAEVQRHTDVEGITRYLGSGLVKQIGPVLAA